VEIRPGEQNGYSVVCGPLEVWFARLTNARKFALGLADDCPIAIFDWSGNLVEQVNVPGTAIT
jgi:hypothetical protein